MAFKNPSLNSGSLGKEKENEIFTRLDKIENEIQKLKTEMSTKNEQNNIVQQNQTSEVNIQKAVVNEPESLDFELSTPAPVSTEKKEEYTELSILDFSGKTYISDSPQRRGLINENQINNILNKENNNDNNSVIGIDSILKNIA